MYSEDEDKKYSVIGKVEIGTDEYRDLIESNVKIKQENSQLYSERYDFRTQLDRANKITISQKEQLEDLKEFLKAENLEDRYQLYLVRKAQKEAQKEDIDE